jgi:anaerobic selenocysteine-containing dehydrogenase
MKEFVTACPRNCYSTCSFRVQVEDNRIIRILPHNTNLATPEGPCIKGLSYIERTHSQHRIIHPLIKDCNGKFQQIPMPEALDIISNKLTILKNSYGPHSILWYKGSGMSGLTNETGTSFWKLFGGATTTYGNLCWPAGLEAVRLTLGSVKHNVPWDIENAETLIIWGKNPAETNIQEISFIARARAKGCRVIVIDPVRTPTADKADIFFSPKPGTDAALALAVAGLIISNGMTDNDFIKENVSGFDEFKKSACMSVAQAEEITGIPASDIESLAQIIGRGGLTTFLVGYGLQRHHNGGQTIRAILSLAVITGNIGKKGAGFNFANLQSYIFDDQKEPLSYYPSGKGDLPFRRSVSMAKLGRDMLEASSPELKSVWIERGNPLLQSPDSNMVKKAFLKLDFRVVVDQFMTDTAAMADIILPAKDIFEQSDIIGSYWSPYVQFKPKVIESPGEVMPESEIYYNLARRMGLEADKKEIPEPGNENIEEWLENRIRGYSSLCLNDLRNGPVLAPGLQQIAYEDRKFETPSGKIELLSAEAEKKWGVDSLPGYSALKSEPEDESYPLIFITPNSASRIHSQFGNLEVIKNSVPSQGLSLSLYDANSRGISMGDRIKVYNALGEIYSQALVSDRIPRGVAVLPNGIWLNEGGGGNHLISGIETDMGYGSAFHDNRVEVEKISVS